MCCNVWGKLIGGAKIMPSLSSVKNYFRHCRRYFIGHCHCRADGADYAVLSGRSSHYRLYRLPDGLLWRPGYVCHQTRLRCQRLGQYDTRYGGMVDRVDSICFAAPVFFHITRYFWNGLNFRPSWKAVFSDGL